MLSMDRFRLISEQFAKSFPAQYDEFCREVVYQLSEITNVLDEAAENAACWARPLRNQASDPLELRANTRANRARVHLHNGKRTKPCLYAFLMTHEKFTAKYGRAGR